MSVNFDEPRPQSVLRQHWAPASLLVLAIIAAVIAVLTPEPPLDRGDILAQGRASQTREIRMTVHPVEINGERRTPTWRELKDTYGLLDRDIDNAIRSHDAQREARATPTAETDAIPPGAEVALQVN
ncbi:MAG: hypothetical protein IT547_03895 [Hyphomonadaceae bacterium]|nr:hypothetical protein [Hyphomonadaceae bacterium]